MAELKYELEFITPAFIGGAEPNVAELRPASVVGMLRWWWRALVYRTHIRELYEKEIELFGGRKGNKYLAGRIWLQIREISISKDNDIKSEYNLKWWFDKRNRKVEGEHIGISYLLHTAFKRPFIKVNSSFKISIKKVPEEVIKHFEASLWCLSTFGGLGLRSRRGFGGAAMVRSDHELVSGLSFKPEQDFGKWLQANISILKENFLKGEVQEFSNLSNSEIIFSYKEFNTWVDALNDIGKVYKKFRDKHRKDVFRVGIFGLPVIHRDKSSLSSDVTSRRASPLIFRVLKTPKGYRWLALKLSGKFLPEGSKLIFRGKKQKPDDSLLNEFWEELNHKGDVIKIGGWT